MPTTTAATPGRQKEYAKAIADYDEAIRLDAKNVLGYLNRSAVQMILRQSEAVAGFQNVVDLEGGKGDLSAYAVILGHFAARLTGDTARGKAILAGAAGKLDTLAWPGPVTKLLRGEIDEPALLAASTDDEKRTEARCFLGLDHALKNRQDQALAHFRWVHDHGDSGSVEYTIAPG